MLPFDHPTGSASAFMLNQGTAKGDITMARKVGIGIVLVALAGLLTAASPAFAQEEAEEPDYRVVSVVVSPDVPTQGETVSVIANVANLADAAREHVLEVSANGAVVASQTVNFEPNETKIVVFAFRASNAGDMTIVLDNVSREVRVVPSGASEAPEASEEEEGKMRVGPSVKLSALRDIITEEQDALVDLFWSNSALNERNVNIELTVDLPSGLYMYSANGAMACAAGRCQGIFEAVPRKRAKHADLHQGGQGRELLRSPERKVLAAGGPGPMEPVEPVHDDRGSEEVAGTREPWANLGCG